MRSIRPGIGPVPMVLFLLTVLSTRFVSASTSLQVELRSGVIRPDRAIDEATHGPQVATQRWIVRTAKG